MKPSHSALFFVGRFWITGEGNGNPLQYSCLENLLDTGTWSSMVHRVARSWTQLKRLSMHAWGPLAGTDQIRSVAQSYPTLCDPMNRSTPGLPVHHQLPEFTQTHVHQVSDAIQPSSVVPFSSCPQSLPASESFPMSQLFA